MVVLAKYERVNENKLHGSTGETSAGTKDAVHTLEHRFRLSRGVAGLTNNRQLTPRRHHVVYSMERG